MKGYITILAVLVLLAVTGGIAVALTFSTIDAGNSEEALRRGEQALFFSESCLEESLLQIIRDPEYGGGDLQLPEGNCSVTVEKNGETYSIGATGEGGQFERNISAEAVLGATAIQVSNWREE